MEEFARKLHYVIWWLCIMAFVSCITEAAMFFGKPGLLWWYILPAVMAPVITQKKEDNE